MLRYIHHISQSQYLSFKKINAANQEIFIHVLVEKTMCNYILPEKIQHKFRYILHDE